MIPRQVCGGDLLESFTVIKEDGEPLWLPEDQQIILAENGVACLEREGVELTALIEQHDILRNNKDNSERNDSRPPLLMLQFIGALMFLWFVWLDRALL